MGGNGPQEQRGGHRKGRELMDERKMEGGRQAWREDRRGGKRIRETEREKSEGQTLRFISRTTVPEVRK